MPTKKNPGRFSIKFNENDPSHRIVIDLLEKQGPHSKAAFIVNAVLHYIHCTETPDIMPMQLPDKTSIETIVLEILERQKEGSPKGEQPVISERKSSESAESFKEDAGETANDSIDDATRFLISDALSAFRSN